jgi:hypothetical protein
MLKPVLSEAKDDATLILNLSVRFAQQYPPLPLQGGDFVNRLVSVEGLHILFSERRRGLMPPKGEIICLFQYYLRSENH